LLFACSKEAVMAARHILFIAVGMAALAGSGLSTAQQYRPDEFLNLDLPSAVLSPKPLGPAGTFRPGPLDVTVDRGKAPAPVNGVTLAEPKAVATATVRLEPNSPATSTAAPNGAAGRVRSARASVERPAAHARRAPIELRHRNPVEAQARDTGIHVWPCKSGGICRWKR
jgi:hypothetical protein